MWQTTNLMGQAARIQITGLIGIHCKGQGIHGLHVHLEEYGELDFLILARLIPVLS